MCRVVAVRAGRGDLDLRFRLWFRRFAPHVGGLEDYGEALAGRRRYAFGRAFIFDRLMSVGALGAEVVHIDDGAGGRQTLASGVGGWLATVCA